MMMLKSHPIQRCVLTNHLAGKIILQLLCLALLPLTLGFLCGNRQALRPEPQAVIGSQPDVCKVKSIERLGPSGGGLDWSHANNLLVLAKYDQNKTKQIYTVKPDGSQETCLTCTQVPGGPSVDVHKGVPHWSPSGELIFLQVEMEEHAAGAMADPGSGQNNDVWAVTADGSQWWRLTDYADNPQAGVLFPVVSHDGTKLAWSQRYAGPEKPVATLIKFLMNRPTADLFGQWQLNIADIIMAENGPRLGNIQSYRPGNASFYEMQVWSPDDSRIYFAANINRSSVTVLDIWAMDVATQELTALTDTDDEWEEHLSISPSGRKITLMSTHCCDFNPNALKTLAAELYLLDTDGSNMVQLTHFNESGYPESSSEQSIVAKSVWSPDGRQVAVQRILLSEEFRADNRITDVWILTFEGACGM